jgi:hypothetical protein
MKRHLNRWNAGLALMMALPLFSGLTNAADVYAASVEVNTSGPQVATTQAVQPTVPVNIDPQSPLAEVIKLVQAGVGETVIASYIANSTLPFNLSSDEIIYLRDLGLSDASINSMLQRDQALGATAQQASAPEPAPVATAPVNAPAATVPEAVPTDPNYTYFYDSLAPYGSWVNVDGYGQCWQPTVCYVNPGWQPYCDSGHWVNTDCGWYWTSDYSWGWAPFHYGRWFHHPTRGWCWAPDRVWGPSWVSWRYNNDYCGWAPLPPGAGFREGVGLTFRGNHVDAGFNFGLSVDLFTFVGVANFTDRHPWEHRVGGGDRVRIYNNTTIINNIEVGNNHTFINHGFGTDRIAQATHTPIRTVHIQENDGQNPGNARHEHFDGGNTLVVNRPPLNQHAPDAGQHTVPHFDTAPRNLPGNGNNHPGVGGGNQAHSPIGNQPGGNAGGNPGNQNHNGPSAFTPATQNHPGQNIQMNGTTHVTAPVTSGGTPAFNRPDMDSRATFNRPAVGQTQTPRVNTPANPTVHSENPFINSGNNGNAIHTSESQMPHLNDTPRYNSPRIESRIVPAQPVQVQPTFPRNNPTPSSSEPAHGQNQDSGSHSGGGNGGNGGGGNRGNGGNGGNNGNGNNGGDKHDH